MQERIIHGNSGIDGDLVIEGFNYIVKGDLTVEGTIIIKDGGLIVEGDLKILSSHHSRTIFVYNGSIYSKSITTERFILIDNGNISTLKDLNCFDIRCYPGNISVGGNASVHSVACGNYLVDGDNYSLSIDAMDGIYIMGYSDNLNITAPEVFLGGGGDFNCGTITADYFEAGGHIYNCLERNRLTKTSK